MSLDQPLLVHCSAGIGRTGTFILLDYAMQQMKREGSVSIYNILKGIRGQRMRMVQTQVLVSLNLHVKNGISISSERVHLRYACI